MSTGYGDIQIPVGNNQGKIATAEGNAKYRASTRWLKHANLFLRGSGLLCSLLALVLMVTAKQRIPVLEKKADFKSSKAFEAIVGASAVVAAYSFLQIVISLASLCKKEHVVSTKKSNALIVYLADQLLTYALYGAAAAATEVAYIAKNGSAMSGWSPVCGSVSKFCNIAGIAIVSSYLAVLALAASSVLSARQFFTPSANMINCANY